MKRILFVHSSKNESLESFEIEKNRLSEFADCWSAGTRREGVQLIRKLKPEIVVLELNAAAGLDFDLFEQTKDQEYQKIILCDTGNYKLKFLRFDIAAYILKPACWVDIKSAVEALLFRTKRYKIQQLYNHSKGRALATLNQVFVSTLDGPKSLQIREIARLQDGGEQRLIHLQDGRVIETTWTMKRMLTLLAGNPFVRLSSDDAVNCKHIVKLQTLSERIYVVMPDGTSLRVPNSKEKAVLRGMHGDDNG